MYRLWLDIEFDIEYTSNDWGVPINTLHSDSSSLIVNYEFVSLLALL